MQYPKYQQISAILGTHAQLMTASEAHGLICGMICGGFAQLETDVWDEAGLFSFGMQDLSQAQQNTVIQLYQITKAKITGMEFDFQILLPDDEVPLQERAIEFGHWCEGFLTGFGLAGGNFDKKQFPDSEEALLRIGDAAQIDYEQLSVSEEDEQAFFDVVEYVRLAVLVIYSDLHTQRDSNQDKGASKKYH